MRVADSEGSFYHKDVFFVMSVGETLPEMITKNSLVQIVKVNVKFLIYLRTPDFWSSLAHAASDLAVRRPKEKLGAA